MAPFGPAFAGAMVAEKARIFEQEGIHISVTAGVNANDPISSVIKGGSTFGITRADTFLAARAHGAPIVAFAAGFIESPAVFYVLKKSGLQNPEDFAGHSVGRRAADDTAMVYDALVERLRLPQSRIKVVPVKSDLSMLLKGEVDVWPGHIAKEEYQFHRDGVDYGVINPARYSVDPLGTVYFTNETTITRQPRLVRRFLAGLVAGWNLAYRDSAASVPIIVSFDPKQLSADFVQFALERQREFLRPLAIRYGEFTQEQWRSLESMLMSQRRLDRSVDLQQAVTYDFLHDVYRKPLAFGE